MIPPVRTALPSARVNRPKGSVAASSTSTAVPMETASTAAAGNPKRKIPHAADGRRQRQTNQDMRALVGPDPDVRRRHDLRTGDVDPSLLSRMGASPGIGVQRALSLPQDCHQRDP